MKTKTKKKNNTRKKKYGGNGNLLRRQHYLTQEYIRTKPYLTQEYIRTKPYLTPRKNQHDNKSSYDIDKNKYPYPLVKRFEGSYKLALEPIKENQLDNYGNQMIYFASSKRKLSEPLLLMFKNTDEKLIKAEKDLQSSLYEKKLLLNQILTRI